jgi:hypothetical protein
MSSGEKYNITDEEAVKIAGLKEMKGLILITSLKSYINLSFVASIVAQDKIDRSKMTNGVLRDGTRVIKRFGEWKDALNPDVNLDYNYYPELATDEVLTEAEFQNKKLLN